MPGKTILFSCFTLFLSIFIIDAHAQSKNFKVLVVMSYEKSYPWVVEIKAGIDSFLKAECQIQYFYMNTKTDFVNGPQKGRQAYDLYLTYHPDGVIVADDDAQAMFVVPYLKDKVNTPVIFCGVNMAPDVYGYPAKNVSGIIEREPMKESLLFLTELMPSVKSFSFISKDSPTAHAVERQLLAEKENYPIIFLGSETVTTLNQAIQATQRLNNSCDALLYVTMEGLSDNNNKPLSDKEIMPVIIKNFNGPVITNATYRVGYGALCAVVKSGDEHGRLAGELLLQAMHGKPVSDIPIKKNEFGRRIINVDTMHKLGITPKPSLIRSAMLIRSKK
ncbi:MAG: ABC transporter substrate-binding protein [Proteobacteria bacterium]|nr:ABC transporter substrate-binding protein [Pseudomonadota bacterium]